MNAPDRLGQPTNPTCLYVADQSRATEFWRAVLDQPPSLHEPGMTEFSLGADTVLGLMPERNICAAGSE